MMNDYNYQTFSANDYDLDDFDGPAVGEKAPDFVCTTIDQQPKRILDFDGELLILELGSITCPLFQHRRAGMSQLRTQYPHVSHAVLYVREAHPGSNIPQHQSFEAKRLQAKALQEVDGEDRLILIDNLNGAAHRAYGRFPNSVYIINSNGCVVYRAKWNNASATQEAVHALLAGQAPKPESVFIPAPPAIMLKILARAGNNAVTDFLRGLPQLIWTHIIRKNLQLFFSNSANVEANFADLEC